MSPKTWRLLPGSKRDDRDRILRPVTDEKAPTGRIEGESIGLRAERVAEILARQDSLNHLLGGGVNNTQGIAPRIGHHDVFLIG